MLRRPTGVGWSAWLDDMDMIKSNLPPKQNHELAEDLLNRFPGVDRAELLKEMVSLYFFNMRHGNKREERAACDFLNDLQLEAGKLAKSSNSNSTTEKA